MVTWFEQLIQPAAAAAYRIEFICFVDGVCEPKAIHSMDGVFKNLYARSMKVMGRDRQFG